MKGRERVAIVDSSAPRLARSIPGLPAAGTIMVRLLRIATFGLSGVFEPVLRAVGLGENQFNVLCFLLASPQGSASPSELSELVGTSRANITRILREMSEAGFIETAAAARDLRRSVIRITAAGRKKVGEAVPHFAEPITASFAGLSSKEMLLLNTLLRKLIVSIDEGSHTLRAAA